MPIKYRFRLKSWKLAILCLVLIVFFTSLGCWQLSRANQKQSQLNAFEARTKLTPVIAKDLHTVKDWRYYRIKLTGKFDNEHTFLLDNKTYERRIGYEVYTPFLAKGFKKAILVNRGFISTGEERDILPIIKLIPGEVTIIGMLNLPPLYMTLGNMIDNIQMTWPLRVEYINLANLSKILKNNLFPYIVMMEPTDKRAYPLTWQTVSMTPERHVGYAVQWFALALTLLILFVALNRDR